jgi:hypothetical protein
MRRGRLGDTTKGLNAAGPDDFLRLSLTGDSKRGRAAAPLCCCQGHQPSARWAPDLANNSGHVAPGSAAFEELLAA